MTTAPTTAPPTPAAVDAGRVTATLVAAFAADPVVRWFYPDASRYLAHFPETLALAGGQAFDAGSADAVADHAGVALWLPPGTEPDAERLADLVERGVAADRHEDAYAFLGQMAAHHPGEPCWHLPFIGVDPRCQGQGLGSKVLAQGLARCDSEGLPAYLEASSPRNRALYERHGFEVVGEIRVADSPPLWPMLRPGR